MKRRAFLLLFLFVLSGCSTKVESFSGILLEVNENSLIVSCAEVFSGNYGDALGYDCPVKLTESTIILNEKGEEIDENELKKRNEYLTRVEVTLVSKTDIEENMDDIRAKIIKIIE